MLFPGQRVEIIIGGQALNQKAQSNFEAFMLFFDLLWPINNYALFISCFCGKKKNYLKTQL